MADADNGNVEQSITMYKTPKVLAEMKDLIKSFEEQGYKRYPVSGGSNADANVQKVVKGVGGEKKYFINTEFWVFDWVGVTSSVTMYRGEDHYTIQFHDQRDPVKSEAFFEELWLKMDMDIDKHNN